MNLVNKEKRVLTPTKLKTTLHSTKTHIDRNNTRMKWASDDKL